MSGFIAWLEKLNEKDTKVRAVLRRSLAFAPAAYPQAYPYVEPFVKGESNSWRREAHYLVAGLWASHWRKGRSDEPKTLGETCFDLYMKTDKSPSIERRFITLLDSDTDQLPYRLRQMIALLKEYPLDFEVLLKDLFYWNAEGKTTQNKWAREFYRNLTVDDDSETTANEEVAQ